MRSPNVRLRWIVAVSLLGALSSVAEEASRPPGEARYAGMTLTEALLELEARGLEILFTSQVVRPWMRVTTEPTGAAPRAVLDQLLAPHGLQAQEGPGGNLVVVPGPARPAGISGQVRERVGRAPLPGAQVLLLGTTIEARSAEDGSFSLPAVPPGTYTLEARLPGFVVEQLSAVSVVAGRISDVAFELVSAPVPLDEIVVTPSTTTLLGSDPAAGIALPRDEILALPHLADDLFRALPLLPGISAQEFSARFHVRGGRVDEVLVRLDQLELFDPYHIRDFASSLSFIAPQAIAEVKLLTGGFPAPFGDRMGGVLDMRTVDSIEGRRHLGLSIVSAQAGGSGRLGDDRGDWLGVARIGSFELLENSVSAEVQPRYWDLFGKAVRQLDAGHRLGLRTLHAEDRLNTEVFEEGDLEQTDTDYRSTYLWLSHQMIPKADLFVDSVLSRGRIERDRGAEESSEGEFEFRVRDRRVLDFTGFKQEWNFQPGSKDRHYLRWGFDIRRLDVEYDYLSDFEVDDLLDIGGDAGAEPVRLLSDFSGEQYSVYLSDRLRLGQPLTIELGLRYDEHTVPGDRDLSPRLNLVAALGDRTSLRGAWGHYFQSQRLYELQVEDGETDFSPSERTEQYVVGFEHAFDEGSTLRFDLYHRDVQNPRPRFENAYEPVDSFPEVQPDRLRIAPERSASSGVEAFFRRRSGQKLDWWLNYTYARVEDEIGGRDVPRSFDQPHAFNADINYRINEHWSVNLAWRYRSGWPTTAVSGRLEEDDEGESEPVLVFGPVNGERLSDYHRLDLRASRQWQLKKGKLSLFIDIQNVYDRRNISGFDVEFEFAGCDPEADECEPQIGSDGESPVIAVAETWGGILPSFGVDWEF